MVLFLLACQPFGSGAAGETVAAEVVELPGGLGVTTVVAGLEIPWDLAFIPDGRILITERPGRIRVVKDGILQETPYATIEVFHRSEAGLMGIALHPDFAGNGYLYVCYTYREGRATFNRIARLTDEGDRAADHHVILDRIPGATRHDGCRIRFGPDGYLYATTGDATEPELSQDLDSLAGKVLRMAADGSMPLDNPFPGSPVYTRGHRNPQGLDWHPATGDLFITEHGPDRDDEVNLLEPGRNYGWPEATGAPALPDYVDSTLALTPTVAIAGAAFVTGKKLPDAWQGNLVFAALKSSHLQRVELAPPDYRAVASRQVLFQGRFGRLRAVVMGPDGYLYFTTSNRDGRGRPREGDDRLLRLGPIPAVSTSQ
jgi:glucose/arabinose dehydrogenase